jgi:hypothetical protein
MSYPNEIPGLRFVAKSIVLNTDLGSIYDTTPDFRIESAVGVLRELPPNFEITFWNLAYPNGKADPGASLLCDATERLSSLCSGTMDGRPSGKSPISRLLRQSFLLTATRDSEMIKIT